MSLYLKYRPKTFEDVISNKGVVSSLKTILKTEDHPHSFMFVGPSGCGKTTIARIIARELDCNDRDIYEVDAGSERGVDTADAMVTSMQYKPFRGSVKVYILDEVQATSAKFQEALLKTLEDTPKHIYFILCTTDPQKIKKTIKNRCAVYEVTKLQTTNIIRLLSKVLKSENQSVDNEILKKIATVADGCPRQALVILDQVLATEKSLQSKIIKSFESDQAIIKDLIDALLKGKKWKDICLILKKLNDEPEKVRISVLMYCNAILLNGRDDPKLDLIMECFENPFYTAGKALLTMACRRILVE